MHDFECFIKEKLNPVYRAHYLIWVYWWPIWRNIYSKNKILAKWQKVNLIREGQTILDYGCGTGVFTIPAAQMVGSKGQVYALDCFERQLQIVAEKAAKARLDNISTILSNGKLKLEDESIDVVWMGDVLHEVKERREVIEELYRVLKQGGVLAIYDGMREKVVDYTTGLFSLADRDGKLLKFSK